MNKYVFKRLQMKKVPSVISWYLVIDNEADLLLLHMNYDVSQSVISELLPV